MKQVAITLFLLFGLLLSDELFAQDMPMHSTNPAAISELRIGLEAMGHDWNVVNQQVEKALVLDENMFMANIFAAFNAYENQNEALIEKYTKRLMGYEGELSPVEMIFGEIIKKGGEEDFSPSPLAQKLAGLYPNDALAQLLAATLLIRNDHPAESLPIFEKAASIKSLPAAHNMIAYIYLRNEDLETAKAHFDKYMKAAPNHANPYDSMGDYYMAAEDYAEAAAYYEKAYATDNSFTISKEKAAAAREKMGEK